MIERQVGAETVAPANSWGGSRPGVVPHPGASRNRVELGPAGAVFGGRPERSVRRCRVWEQATDKRRVGTEALGGGRGLGGVAAGGGRRVHPGAPPTDRAPSLRPRSRAPAPRLAGEAATTSRSTGKG